MLGQNMEKRETSYGVGVNVRCGVATMENRVEGRQKSKSWVAIRFQKKHQLPGGSDGKESACQAGDTGFSPWIWKTLAVEFLSSSSHSVYPCISSLLTAASLGNDSCDSYLHFLFPSIQSRVSFLFCLFWYINWISLWCEWNYQLSPSTLEVCCCVSS